MFCATSMLGISLQHSNNSNLLANTAYWFKVYFHLRIILDHLAISFSYKDSFNKVINSYIKSVYCSIYDDYGTNANEIWINGGWFCTTRYVDLTSGWKAKSTSPPPDNLTRWTTNQSKSLVKKRYEKISRSFEAYVCLLRLPSNVFSFSISTRKTHSTTEMNLMKSLDKSAKSGVIILPVGSQKKRAEKKIIKKTSCFFDSWYWNDYLSYLVK